MSMITRPPGAMENVDVPVSVSITSPSNEYRVHDSFIIPLIQPTRAASWGQSASVYVNLTRTARVSERGSLRSTFSRVRSEFNPSSYTNQKSVPSRTL